MASKPRQMSYLEREEMMRAEFLTEKIKQQGIPLTLFYAFLGIVGDGISFFRSLDEKYNLIERFGLGRIW